MVRKCEGRRRGQAPRRSSSLALCRPKGGKGTVEARLSGHLPWCFSVGRRGFREEKFEGPPPSASPFSPGFTLIEVLAAVVILGFALATILTIFSQGLNMASLAEDHAIATLLARSKLDEILLEREVEEGSDSGTFEDFDGRYSYRVSIVEQKLSHLEREKTDFDSSAASAATGDEEPYYKTYAVKVVVSWDDESASMELATLRTDYVNPQAAN